tara:strand:- start:245 stop:895 length:651 start_codon:yes stop_codon:yes gene_type:complete
VKNNIKIQSPVTIIANGSFPIHKYAMNKLHESNFIISCDGATNKLINNNMEPNLIIGDLDSISHTLLNKYNNMILKDSSQNLNDLSKAILWLIENNIKEASILGSTGIREDHSIANIDIVLKYSHSINLTIYTDTGKFIVVSKKNNNINSFKGQQVSIFSMDHTIQFSSKYLKFKLNETKLLNLHSGTLNESKNNTFHLNLSHGKALVFLTYKEQL